MDCSEFRRRHVAYVDDTLPGDLVVAAERHRAECACCAAHDTRVRRSLLLARNLPEISVSTDFEARLNARLRAVMAAGRDGSYESAWEDDGSLDGITPVEARRWYERLAVRQGVLRGDVLAAGGWARQAIAAGVLLAAVSAGYAMRGAGYGGATAARGAGATPSAADDAARAVVAPNAFPPPAVAVRFADAPRVGGRASARQHAARGRVVAGEDQLGEPMYVPLPAGAIEASALVGPASVGIPVWPAALLAGDAPSQLGRVVPGAPSVRLVGLTH